MAWGRGAAEQLARMLELVAGQPVPVRLRAWDGSEHGPPDAPLVVVHGPGRCAGWYATRASCRWAGHMWPAR